MKKSLIIRIMAALGGLALVTFGILTLAETFFHVTVMEDIGKVMFSDAPLAVLLSLLVALIMLVLGASCMLLPFASQTLNRRGYVMQKSENGVIGVSVKSIEGLVQTCVAQHEMVAKAEVSVVERREGIVILLNIEEAAGMNIPLAVGALQKQIKQYVNTCTGVDVQEVRVMVENTADEATGSPYAVEKPALLAASETETSDQDEAAEESAEEAPAEENDSAEETNIDEEAAPHAPVLENLSEEGEIQDAVAPVSVPVMPLMPEIPEEEDDRPLHQRLFGAEEQPVFVPAPPELVIESQEEDAVEDAVEAAEESAEADEEIAADAVLEVVEAIAAADADESAEESSAEENEEKIVE